VSNEGCLFANGFVLLCAFRFLIVHVFSHMSALLCIVCVCFCRCLCIYALELFVLESHRCCKLNSTADLRDVRHWCLSADLSMRCLNWLFSVLRSEYILYVWLSDLLCWLCVLRWLCLLTWCSVSSWGDMSGAPQVDPSTLWQGAGEILARLSLPLDERGEPECGVPLGLVNSTRCRPNRKLF